MPTNFKAQLRATTEETREMQLVLLYNVLGFRLCSDRYNVVSILHETGPWSYSILKVVTVS